MSSAKQKTSDNQVVAPELDLRGFGLSYADIQRAKAGDFGHVRDKVRRRGKRFTLWGRILVLVLIAFIVGDLLLSGAERQGFPSLLEITLIIGFLVGPPLFAKKQQERLEEILAQSGDNYQA